MTISRAKVIVEVTVGTNMVVPLEVDLQRKGSLHAPKEKHDIDRPWSNGSRAALLAKNPQKAQVALNVSPAEADGSAVEEEKKLLGKRGQRLKQAGRINCLTYVPEARVIAAGREDGKLLLWKVWKTEGEFSVKADSCVPLGSSSLLAYQVLSPDLQVCSNLR